MGFIFQKEVSSISVSEVTGQLARIQSQADGDAAVALLDEYDRLLLNSAISSYSKEKSISIASIAKDLGVGRTYLYNLLDSNQIELNRLRVIQNYLGINILPEETIDLFLKDLKKKLLGESYTSTWIDKCNHIPVDKFYLLEFLLPSMKRQVIFWEHLVSMSKENDKSIFGDVTSAANYKFSKMIEYIEDLDTLVLDYFDELDRLHGNLKTENIFIPIDPLCSYWADVEDEIDEAIISYCDELASDEKKELERATSKKEKKDRHEIISFFEKDLRKALDRCHKEFFKEFDKEYDKVETAQKKILEYMKTNNRLEKKQTHWPLELLEFAEKLEENTIPKKEMKTKVKSKK